MAPIPDFPSSTAQLSCSGTTWISLPIASSDAQPPSRLSIPTETAAEPCRATECRRSKREASYPAEGSGEGEVGEGNGNGLAMDASPNRRPPWRSSERILAAPPLRADILMRRGQPADR